MTVPPPLTWKAPTSTVNGGYADYNAITYNVYRGLGETVTPVATGISSTEFSETITDNGGFFYVIEPLCGGITGVSAKSETFVLTSTATIPYFTGFEDDGDGSQWTIINNPASAGWSIGKRATSTTAKDRNRKHQRQAGPTTGSYRPR